MSSASMTIRVGSGPAGVGGAPAFAFENCINAALDKKEAATRFLGRKWRSGVLVKSAPGKDFTLNLTERLEYTTNLLRNKHP
jgi:hypothetical protein